MTFGLEGWIRKRSTSMMNVVTLIATGGGLW